MLKKIVILILFSCSFGLKQGKAKDQDFERFCKPPNEPTSQVVCGLAVTLNVPVMQAGVGSMIASIYMTGNYCNFRFSKSFADFQSRYKNNSQVQKVIDHLKKIYEGKLPPGHNGDTKFFCTTNYEMLGPSSTSRMFQ
jgi:hypothetical protein